MKDTEEKNKNMSTVYYSSVHCCQSVGQTMTQMRLEGDVCQLMEGPSTIILRTMETL